MMFLYPEAFYLVIIWAVFCLLIWLNQGLALAWLRRVIAGRFLSNFTRYSPGWLIFHIILIFLMGFCLIWAIAAPYASGHVKQMMRARHIFIVIDASYSMFAADCSGITKTELQYKNRFTVAKGIAVDLIALRSADQIGLITFSGRSVIHATPTSDHGSLTLMLNNMEPHLLYQTGSDFSRPLAQVINTLQLSPDNYVIVLISDGEAMPKEQDFNKQVEMLSVAHVPVFTVGVGSEAGGDIIIYDQKDLYNKVANPRLIKTEKSYRDSSTLRDIARGTGGEYLELENGRWVEAISSGIDKTRVDDVEMEDAILGKVDSSHTAVIIFLILFFCEMAYLFPRPAGFVVWLFPVILFNSCQSKLIRAHRTNEKGIDKYEVTLFENAREQFSMSALFHLKEEIPLLNLGNAYIMQKEYGHAHDFFQRAIRVNPDMGQAYFNDGVALFLQGEDEIDPTGCYWTNSSKLFKQAIARFELAGQKGVSSQENIAYLKKRIEELRGLFIHAKNCPPPPQQQNEPKPDDDPPPPRENPQQQQQQQQQNQNQNQQNNQKQNQQNNQNNQQQNQQQQNQQNQQNQNQNQNQNQQNQQQSQNDPQQTNSNQGQGNDKRGQGGMSSAEEQKIKENLERIKRNSGRDVGFNQTEESQRGGDGNVDQEVLW